MICLSRRKTLNQRRRIFICRVLIFSMKNEQVIEDDRREGEKNEGWTARKHRGLERVENGSGIGLSRRVKPIKSNATNSFNGRDPKLAIYLEGYRTRLGQKFGLEQSDWWSAVTFTQTRLPRRFNLPDSRRNLLCLLCCSPHHDWITPVFEFLPRRRRKREREKWT